MPFVYILQDKITGKHYTGSCLEISKRINRHKSHTGGMTTSIGEWELLCFKEVVTMNEAGVLEKLVKRQNGGNGFRKIVEEWKRG